MKKILGSFCISFIFSLSMLWAGYSWEVKIDKKRYYQNEPFLVTFLCHFDNRSDAVFIEFKPRLKGFEFERYDFDNQVIDGKREVSYRYFAKALKSGKQSFSVPILMRKTSDESIRETVLGRDNDQDLVFVDTHVNTKKIMLDILPTPKESQLVGSFDLEINYSKERLRAFEPLQLKLTISGEGDFKSLQAFDFAAKGVKIFEQKPERSYKLTEKGYVGKLIWRYALTSQNDFTLKEQNIYYFDPKEAVLKSIHFPQKLIPVTGEEEKESLVDSENYPKDKKPFDWMALGEKLFYFLLGILFAGVIAKIKKLKKQRAPKVKKFSNISELVTFLVKSGRYRELLSEIEADIKDKKIKKLSVYIEKLSPKDRF